MINVKDMLKKTWVKQVFLVIFILSLSQIGAWCFRIKAGDAGQKILDPIARNVCMQNESMTKLSAFGARDTQKLLDLYNYLYTHKEKHKAAFLYFYPYYFASSVLLIILSSLSVVVIFLVAQKGLSKASPYMRTIFFTLAALTSFYALSPVVFKQESNIANNLEKYIRYDNLQGEVYNYAITGPILTANNDSLTLPQFHSLMIKNMAEINSITVEFDYKSIPMPDYGINKEKQIPGDAKPGTGK